MHILSLSMAFLTIATLCNAQGDPKGGEPPPCCPEDTTKVPTCSYSVSGPKGGSSTTYTVGEMSDVLLGNDLCLEYPKTQTTPLIMSITATGGSDSDVCKDSEGNCAYIYGVDTNYIWSESLPGAPSSPNSSTFITAIPDPGSFGLSPCKTYDLTVSANDSGECNVGEEEKSDTITVQVWKCKENLATTSGNSASYYLCEGHGLATINWSVFSKYVDCNGQINAVEQWGNILSVFTLGSGDVTSSTSFGMQHCFMVDNTNTGCIPLTQNACGLVMLPQGARSYCGFQAGSGTCSSSVESKFIASLFINTISGACVYPPVSKSIGLDKVHCCGGCP